MADPAHNVHTTVRCPDCQQVLKVPASAAGRHARCPVCKTKFQVPAPKELLEETVSTWIEEDLDQFLQERDEDGVEETSPTAADREESPRTEEPIDQQPGRARPLTPAAASSQLSSGDTIVAEAITDKPEQAPGESGPSGDDASSRASETAEAAGDEVGVGSSEYPSNINLTELVPHLVVHQVTQQGITFAFDSIWLQHDGFRASMPIMCAFCGMDVSASLTARPLIFLDRAMDQNASWHDIEAGMPVPLKKTDTPQSLIAQTHRLADMTRPFDIYMPFYTCPKHLNAGLKCTTRTRREGGTTCHVLIPNGRPTAVRWLSNVNGICGPESALLQRDVETIASEAWQQLSETCRQRLAVWATFEAGERFEHYLSDADLSKHDEGLAGVVVTNHRLIYHKYHHHGQVRLDEDATLTIARGEKMAALTLDAGGHRMRVAKIHARDVARLIDALSHAPRLQVMVVKQAPKG